MQMKSSSDLLNMNNGNIIKYSKLVSQACSLIQTKRNKRVNLCNRICNHHVRTFNKMSANLR